MNEAETRAELVDPALRDAGWGVVEGSRVRREHITLGRLQGAGKRAAAHELNSETASKAKYVWDPSGSAGTDAYGGPNTLNEYPSITFNGGTPTSLIYDQNGNLTGDWNLQFTYDPENRLLSSYGSSGTTTYSYDPKGRRATKVSGSTATNFLDDGDDEIAEYDGSGNLLRRYVPGPAIDDRIAEVTASGTYEYFHTDHHGSVVGMSDSSGNLTEGPFLYDSYGNPPCPGAGGIPYRYTGQRVDPETCFYYYRARYYTASLGRFLQVDPVGYTADLDLYTYVGNDPTNGTDPKGLYDCSGNTSDCNAVNSFVAGVDKAAKNLGSNSTMGKNLNALAKYLGKAGDKNGVTISSTSLAGAKVAEAGDNGHINVDVGKITKLSASFARANANFSSSGLRNAYGAGAVGHEARHELDFQRFGRPTDRAGEFRTEENAYRSQAEIFRGLGFKSGLWNPGMAVPQQDMAIEDMSQRSTECWAAGECGQ